ncbi:MAG: hypothetical protein IJX08_01195, partial [Clostridia bacterium]|nr:hypothetical protein [Clostridia bacterium]
RTAKKRKIVYVISATASVLVLLAGILTLMILQTPPPQPTEPIFTDPTESAATSKSPTQAPSPSQSTPEKELPPANTLEDLWAQYTEENFIWGEES